MQPSYHESLSVSTQYDCILFRIYKAQIDDKSLTANMLDSRQVDMMTNLYAQTASDGHYKHSGE
jgi:hypothetical protein